MTIVLRLLLAASLTLFLALSACSSSKPKEDAFAEKEKVTTVDVAKESAEAAEWEAHRLREELHRKKIAP